VVDQSGYLHGLSLQDGTLVARNKIGDKPVFAQPIAIDDRLFLLNKDGVLMAYGTEVADPNLSFWDMPSNRQKGAVSTKSTGVK
jgi:hypothetical protein